MVADLEAADLPTASIRNVHLLLQLQAQLKGIRGT